jgi:hypothetical protein
MSADAYALPEDQRVALDLTPAQAARCAELARAIGPLSAEQRDRLAVLLACDRGRQYRARGAQ